MRSPSATATPEQIARKARRRFGTPTHSNSRELRFRRRGSLKVTLTGPRAGTWFDFEHHQGGRLIDAQGEDTAAREREQRQADRQRRTKAARIVAAAPTAARDAAPARRYLDGRGITAEPPDHLLYTEDHRWLEGNADGALVIPIVDDDGQPTAVQRIYVRADGSKANCPDLPKNKRSNGRQAGAFVLPGPAGGPVVLCEGPETGLSLWQATGYEVHVALGPIAKANPPRGRTLIVARDGDAPDSQADKAVWRAVRGFDDGAQAPIYLATPPEGDDFNDVLARDGEDAVRSAIEHAAAVGGPPAPRFAPPVRQLVDARQALEDRITGFFDAAITHHRDAERRTTPPRQLLPVDLGTGKTRAARLVAAARIRLHDHHASIRAGAEDAQAHQRMTRGVIAVPTHALGDEVAAGVRHAGISAHVWRGREADREDGAGAMCEDLDAVRDALAVGADVESSVCRTVHEDGSESRCPLYDACAYQAQKPQARDAQVVIVPHDLLSHGMPSAVRGDGIGWLIIDEDPTDSLLRGGEAGAPVTLDELAQAPTCYDGRGHRKVQDSQELADYRQRLVTALRDHADGYTSTAALIEAGITAQTARRAAQLERGCERDAGIYPGMPPAERAQAVEQAAGNRRIPLRQRAWWLIAEAIDAETAQAAGVEIGETKAEGGRARAIRLRWCAGLGSGWRSLPTLVLDATADPEIVREWLPEVTAHAPIRVQAPHTQVRQVTDASFSALKLDPSRASRDREAKAARGHLRDLHAYIQRRAREHETFTGGADVLVVAQESVETELRSFTLRPNVRTAHFNALRGLDGWKDVRCLIVVGRPQPAAPVIEAQHAALTNRAPSARPDHPWWYDEVRAGLTARGGGPAAAVSTPQHPDELCERMRWQVCEAELVQAIGRARGVNRSASDPVAIDVLTDMPLPIEVDQPVRWEDIAPGMRDLMLARGIAAKRPAHAAALYPDLWPSAGAAREGARTEAQAPRSVRNVYGESRKTNLTLLYRVAGQGQKRAEAEVDPALVADPAAIIEGALGEIDADVDQDALIDARERMHGLRRDRDDAQDAEAEGTRDAQAPQHRRAGAQASRPAPAPALCGGSVDAPAIPDLARPRVPG